MVVDRLPLRPLLSLSSNFDEFYAIFILFFESYNLNHFGRASVAIQLDSLGASFAESFYGLTRFPATSSTPQQHRHLIWTSLVELSLVPYAERKLERAYEAYNDEQLESLNSALHV